MYQGIELTKDAVKVLYTSEYVPRAVLQILGFCYCDFTCSGSIFSCTRRCIRVSDGENFIHAFLSSEFWENEGNPEVLHDNWIFELEEYHLSQRFGSRIIFLIHRVKMLSKSPDIKCIGTPTSIEPKSEFKWYNMDDFDQFYTRVDLICELQEAVRVGKRPSQRVFGEIHNEPKFSASQEKHLKNGQDTFEDTIAYFKKHRHNPNEMVTPFMTLTSDASRRYLNPVTIENCYQGEPLAEPMHIQIVDFRLITDRKKEEYYYILINDGVQMTTAILCPYHMNKDSPYRGPRGIKKYCIVQFQAYSCMTVSKKRKCIVFHELLGDILEHDSVIRFLKLYPEFVEDSQYTNDPLLHNLMSFAEVMEKEAIKLYGCRKERRTEAPKPFKVKKTKHTSENNLPNGESVISVGAVEKLCHAEEVKNPILQILLFKKIIHMSTERYALLLSDGYDIITSMVEPALMKSVPKSTFQPYTVIRILKYSYFNILMERKTLLVQKLGYHIPITPETKKPIGSPTFYACDIEHSPEVLKTMPKFSPYQAIASITSQSHVKKKIEEHMMMKLATIKRNEEESSAPSLPSVVTDHTEAISDSAQLTPIYGPNRRIPALSGFCKYADQWHDKITNTTQLPDGRLIIRRPATQTVPYQVSTGHDLPRKFQGKVVMKR